MFVFVQCIQSSGQEQGLEQASCSQKSTQPSVLWTHSGTARTHKHEASTAAFPGTGDGRAAGHMMQPDSSCHTGLQTLPSRCVSQCGKTASQSRHDKYLLKKKHNDSNLLGPWIGTRGSGAGKKRLNTFPPMKFSCFKSLSWDRAQYSMVFVLSSRPEPNSSWGR